MLVDEVSTSCVVLALRASTPRAQRAVMARTFTSGDVNRVPPWSKALFPGVCSFESR